MEDDIERIAKILRAYIAAMNSGGVEPPDSREVAKEMIIATLDLLSDPTPEMISAGWSQYAAYDPEDEDFRDIFRAMLRVKRDEIQKN